MLIKKILTIYYLNAGNTKNAAQNINYIVGGDIKEIELIENYPNNIFTMSKYVRKQMKEGLLPQIKDIDISNYDIIFVGSPVWNFSMSLLVKVFLKLFYKHSFMPFIFKGGWYCLINSSSILMASASVEVSKILK